MNGLSDTYYTTGSYLFQILEEEIGSVKILFYTVSREIFLNLCRNNEKKTVAYRFMGGNGSFFVFLLLVFFSCVFITGKNIFPVF